MMNQNETVDEKWMRVALQEALVAQQEGEVPVGAVLVGADRIIAKGHNQTIGRCDPTAHAEINAIRAAAHFLGNYRLLSTTLYVTVEPCVMCMGAIVHARVTRLVFGAHDPKWGAVGSLYDFSMDSRLNHHPEIVSGVLKSECRDIIQEFFKFKRALSKKVKE